MIRRATAADAAPIAALFRRSFGSIGFLPTLHTPEEDLDYFARVIAGEEVWAYEEEGRILAFASIGADSMHHLYVEPGACGGGIGSALLVHAKHRRPDGLRLWTFQRNQGARRFYERHGFRVVELTDGARNEEGEPDMLYEWRPQRAARADAR